MRLLGLLVLPLVPLTACGADFATVEPKNPERAADGLVVTRADGSSYELENAVASCYAAEQKPDLEVLRLTAPAAVTRGDRSRGTFLVEVVPGTTGTYRLPLKERDFAAGPSDVTMFLLDPRRENEVDGSREESDGQITIRESTCDPEPAMSVTVDATLASEVGLPALHVEGGMASSPK